MAAPLNVNREAVRVLVCAVGVREAARQCGLGASVVAQWSARFGWLKGTKPALELPKSMQPQAVSGVINPANALRQMMLQDEKSTKIGLSKATRKAAETLSESSGRQIVKQAKQLRDVTATAAQLHGWDKGKTTGIDLRIGVAFGGMA